MTFSGNDLFALLPYLITAGGAIVLMLAIAIRRSHAVANGISLITLAAALVSLFSVGQVTPQHVTDLLLIDDFTLFYSGLVLGSGLAVNLMAYAYFQRIKEHQEEFYMLLLLGVLGAQVLVGSQHFASLFLGLELMSIALYAMIGYLRLQDQALEAGTKYLVLASASSAFLIFGMALVYVASGAMQFDLMASRIGAMDTVSPLLIGGFAMMIVGVGFKLAVFPFHMWTPDVYQGAPAPVTAFIATVSKGGMFAVWVRFFVAMDGYSYPTVLTAIGFIAIASMLIGNLLALLQTNVKRILAYSSIAHLGYVLVAFLAGGSMGVEAITFYLMAYLITSLGSFGIVAMLSGDDQEAEQIHHYNGLFWRKPWIAAAFTAMLLSLAGIPLTAGFVGKYYILAAGANEEMWGLIVVLIISSVIGLYYYLRIVAAMFSEQNATDEAPVGRFNLANGFALALLAVMILWFGVYPTYVIDAIQNVVGSLY